MDTSKEGYILIATTMIILVVFPVVLFLIMVIYRRRRLEYRRDMEAIKEKNHKEMLEVQVEIQRDMMQQIGREIHDNVGQKLTLASLYTSHLDLAKSKELSSGKIASVGELINESLHDLRELSRHLNQSTEGLKSLNILLQKEVAKVNDSGICKAVFAEQGEPAMLSLRIVTMIIRIAQEFLSNSLRHSRCTNLSLSVVYRPDGFQMDMTDDGKGFSLDVTMEDGGLGLGNMRKRASLIGAELKLNSNPGNGATLYFFLPRQNFTQSS